MNPFGNKIDSLLSTDRIANLIKYSTACAHLGGYLAEFGTYHGGSLEIMAKYNPGVSIIGLDSFEGVSEPTQNDFHQQGDLVAMDVRKVIGYFSYVYPAVRIVKGWIPQVFDFFDEHTRFSFVHTDLDMETPIYQTLDFVLPRLLTGGMILLDDYKVRSTPGCKVAIDRFFEKHPNLEYTHRQELKLYDHENAKSSNQYLIIK